MRRRPRRHEPRRAGAEAHVLHVGPGFEPAPAEALDDLPAEDRAFYERVWAEAG